MQQTSEDRFAAALAHQLKNPTASLEAACVNLRRNLLGLFEEAAEMSTRGRVAAGTFRFLAGAINEPAPPPSTGLLPRDRLAVLEERLRAAGLDGDLEDAAARLARGGWDTYIGDIAPLLVQDRSATLDLLETAARLRSNLSGLGASSARIRVLAGAMRMLSLPDDGQPLDPARGLVASVELARAALPPGVRLDLVLDRTPLVRARQELLQEVWSNLLVNAARAVGELGTIRVESEGTAMAIVRVIDDGGGIPDELIGRVFEPHVTTGRNEGGEGLGLPIALRIVRKYGGEIQVTSRPGRTCFEVTLPAAAEAAAGR